MAKGIRWQYGAWQFSVQIHGQRHYKPSNMLNPTQAYSKAIAARDEWIDKPCPSAGMTPPYHSVILVAFLAQTDVKPSTAYSYKQILNQYWLPKLSTKPVYTIRRPISARFWRHTMCPRKPRRML